MPPAPNSKSPKSARGRPPVALKTCASGLRTASGKQKSRPLAAPRRSMAGTCEKPATDSASVACVALLRHHYPADHAVDRGRRRAIVAADPSQAKEVERPNQPDGNSIR
jgi:hypothetical protein